VADPELAVWSSPVDDDSPLTRASLAKLVLAYDARELAEAAHGFVATYGSYEDVTIEEVGRLVLAPAKRLVDAAVVAARLRGVSWETIGEVLEITRQSAHARYAEAEKAFEAMLDEPEATAADGTRYNRQHPALRRPDETAAELDAWAVRHREDPPHSFPGRDRPVSDGLRRMDPLTELMDLSSRRRRLRDEAWEQAIDRIGGAAAGDQNADDLDQTADLFEREARVHQHMADVVVPAQSVLIRPAMHQDYATEAAKSRALAEKYRRDAATLRAAVRTSADRAAPDPNTRPDRDSEPMPDNPSEPMLDDWLNKARFVHRLAPTEPWPAWSTGELLAVAVILHDTQQLAAMQYTRDEALERLRHDIGLPNIADAATVFDSLSRHLKSERA